jgi:hypothetical protein
MPLGHLKGRTGSMSRQDLDQLRPLNKLCSEVQVWPVMCLNSCKFLPKQVLNWVKSPNCRVKIPKTSKEYT